MTLNYDAGSSGSTGYATGLAPLSALGLVEFPGVLIGGAPLRIHDGTFVLAAAGGLTDTPEIRSTDTTAAFQHGAYLSSSFYEPRGITLEGYALTAVVDDLWPALEQLRRINLRDPAGLYRVESLMPGWAERRFVDARPSGPIIVAEPSRGSAQRQPYREFQIPLLAPDPRIYGATLLNAANVAGPAGGAVGSTNAVLDNAGNFPAPLRWVVNGPYESPSLIDDARGRAIAYAGPVPTGSTLIVDTLARTATLNGANVYQNLTRFDDLEIPPGGATYRTANNAATNAGGTWRAEHRSTWI